MLTSKKLLKVSHSSWQTLVLSGDVTSFLHGWGCAHFSKVEALSIRSDCYCFCSTGTENSSSSGSINNNDNDDGDDDDNSNTDNNGKSSAAPPTVATLLTQFTNVKALSLEQTPLLDDKSAGAVLSRFLSRGLEEFHMRNNNFITLSNLNSTATTTTTTTTNNNNNNTLRVVLLENCTKVDLSAFLGTVRPCRLERFAAVDNLYFFEAGLLRNALAGVRTLDLSGSRWLTGAAASAIFANEGITSTVEDVALSNTPVDNDALATVLRNCTRLRSLRAVRCRGLTARTLPLALTVGSDGERRPLLRVLDFGVNMVRDDAAKPIVESFPGLMSLSLAWTNVTDDAAEILAAGLHNLVKLDLRMTRVSQSKANEISVTTKVNVLI